MVFGGVGTASVRMCGGFWHNKYKMTGLPLGWQGSNICCINTEAVQFVVSCGLKGKKADALGARLARHLTYEKTGVLNQRPTEAPLQLSTEETRALLPWPPSLGESVALRMRELRAET